MCGVHQCKHQNRIKEPTKTKVLVVEKRTRNVVSRKCMQKLRSEERVKTEKVGCNVVCVLPNFTKSLADCTGDCGAKLSQVIAVLMNVFEPMQLKG